MISCIMPTRGRQWMAAQAVEQFQQQTFPDRELIVVDDVDEPSFPSGLVGANLRHICGTALPIGAKRNLAVEHARGDVIAHWDSDDIYSPARLERQRVMLAGNVDLVGFNELEFVDEVGTRWSYRAPACDPVGASFMYWKRAWQTRPFKWVNAGEDVEFSMGRVIAACPATGLMTARIHRGNTVNKHALIERYPAQWKQQ